ncbi:hypothetical protein [Sphingomonas sp. 3P27F8]|uniref:hypothetical protein n=2 Tax=unclassified Sphingomonas TaxID=196159 RepID=UPI0010F930C4|nr:hypothetical protein [Sphingomonas sp. 3P27F8]
MDKEAGISSDQLPLRPSYHDPEEIRSMLLALSRDDFHRIETVSRFIAQGDQVFAADLRQEAMARLLEGRRKCPVGMEIVSVINGVMKSMMSAEREAEAEGNRPVLIGVFGEDGYDAASPMVSPEQAGHDALHYRRTIASVRAALAGDPQLLALLDAIMDGLRGKALEERLGLTTRQLADERKKLRRRLAAATANRSMP